MSFFETFDSDLGSYITDVPAGAPGVAEWDGTTGNPLSGCAHMHSELKFPNTTTVFYLC